MSDAENGKSEDAKAEICPSFRWNEYMSDGSFQNRLIKEKSPYLLQHAHNPVDWYPWGEEAFEAAKGQDKPIFLSIGYATCHFCHVMNRESFNNPEIAALLNESFINIKVDREELPEIDSLYMEFAQALLASGSGWPLNLVLTPQLRPFYASTYMPPETRQEMIGLKELALQIQKLWSSGEREMLLEQAEKLVDFFARNVQTRGDSLPDESHVEGAIQTFFDMIDPVYGGVKGVPKFPIGYQIHFFLHYGLIYEDSRPLFYSEMTLDRMHRGGIYDRVGGGFFRYSVDEKWAIPHFEKMLCDNAILAAAYLEMWLLTQKPFYREVCEEILDYVLRDMQHSEGGFYSAEDAKSDGKEGEYYIWTLSEVQKLLSEEELDLFCDCLDVTSIGNFEGGNVLHLIHSLEEISEIRGVEVKELQRRLKGCLKTLYEARQKRKRPLRDDKILVSWNAMMIHVLAQAGWAFKNETYLQKAKEAALFIRSRLWKNGRLLRRFQEGEACFEGGLDDYAYLIRALLTLFEVDRKGNWLNWALEMTALLEKEFKADNGAFYQTGPRHLILLRRAEIYDGAEPSGNAIHAENLLRLNQLTYNQEYRIQAEDILKAARTYIESYPAVAAYHLTAFLRYLDKDASTFIIALNREESLKEEISDLLKATFHPHRVIIWKYFDDRELAELLPHLEELVPIENQTTLYTCKQGKCQKPLTILDEMRLEAALKPIR